AACSRTEGSGAGEAASGGLAGASAWLGGESFGGESGSEAGAAARAASGSVPTSMLRVPQTLVTGTLELSISTAPCTDSTTAACASAEAINANAERRLPSDASVAPGI